MKKRAIQRRDGIGLPMINTSPVGSERIRAASNGRPGGRNSVVSTYVVPKMIGVSAARYPHPPVCRSDTTVVAGALSAVTRILSSSLQQ